MLLRASFIKSHVYILRGCMYMTKVGVKCPLTPTLVIYMQPATSIAAGIYR